jgi:hypothetical protein
MFANHLDRDLHIHCAFRPEPSPETIKQGHVVVILVRNCSNDVSYDSIRPGRTQGVRAIPLMSFLLLVCIMADEQRQSEDGAVLEPYVKRQAERVFSCGRRVLLGSSLVPTVYRMYIASLSMLAVVCCEMTDR